MTTRPTGVAGAPGNDWTIHDHWEDLQGSVAQGAAGAALTFAAFRDTPFKFASFRDAQNDELHMAYQMPHGWHPGTVVKPHIHIIPLAAAAGVVRFSGVYAWALFGQEVPAAVGWTSFTVDKTIAAGDVNKMGVVLLGTITPPAAAVESDCLLIYFKREGGAAEDTYAGNIAAVSIDTHFYREKIGTVQEFQG